MNESDPWNWDNDEPEDKPVISERVLDISFKLQCQCLHVDHTTGLYDAVSAALPWFANEPLAGLHLIYVAGSQNGWMRPEGPDELLHLSRRTRLTLRIPTDRLNDVQTMTGQVLDVAGNAMTIGEATEKPVTPNDILFSRHVLAMENEDENAFLQRAADELKNLGIRFKKLLPGKQQNLRAPAGTVNTRSLMVADMNTGDSLILQEQGLGDGRQYGCGLFIHHKGIKAVQPDD